MRYAVSHGKMRTNKIILHRLVSRVSGNVRDFSSPHVLTELRDKACLTRENSNGPRYNDTIRCQHMLNRPSPAALPPPPPPRSAQEHPAGRSPLLRFFKGQWLIPSVKCQPMAGAVRHYSLTWAAMQATLNKARWDEEHPSKTWNDNACSMQTKMGTCMDYARLYRFMNATHHNGVAKHVCPNLPSFPYCFSLPEAEAHGHELFLVGTRSRWGGREADRSVDHAVSHGIRSGGGGLPSGPDLL